MLVNDVNNCSFNNWYKSFEALTIPSIILPIPCNVLSYLQESGTLVLPEGSYNELRETEEGKEEWEDESSANGAVAIAPNLNEFNQEIKEVIKKLGGTVFPKLNWSSPKDASWISFNKSLQCSNPGDIYILLKSSDFVTHDLTSPFKDCSDKETCIDKVDYHLVLRKWTEINPSDEFRCFVKDRELIGISQRDISQYYSSIHRDKDCIVDDIILFWEEHIRNYFPSFSYAFDVHRPKDGHITLIDFGPFGNTTDGLMFSWEELKTINIIDFDEDVDSNRIVEEFVNEECQPQFKYITNATGVQPSPYSRYGLPLDIVDLNSGLDSIRLIDLLQMRIKRRDDVSSSDDNDDDGDDGDDDDDNDDEDDNNDQGESSLSSTNTLST